MNVTKNKYWLPEGVEEKSGQSNYTKHSKITFIDKEYGEFISTYTQLQRFKHSLHPIRVKQNRIQNGKNLQRKEVYEKRI